MSEWIPVSERLPDKDGDYLVTTVKGNVDIAEYYARGLKSKPQVRAWMPLPEPYKEAAGHDKSQ